VLLVGPPGQLIAGGAGDGRTIPFADIGFADEVERAAGYNRTNTGTLPSASTFDV
jgi:hypothetical protein